ncbi:sulfatase-like hydrolase/transferase [Cognatiyoonia sp. IB215446]|uniref:sulfatase-like hydrolase/transferase n=1 Tax=Cognatiyoonia sp. IB215446 TaxID=3097355 RepID=UPI002A12F09B|nr:sulfatase-like hydrolase/transferase [Cognatiyoonia sp. IB215446]MDX8347971.1 sulfatase-like hydrolase/transferase [Cognatiyoonia sp. IB215446]
MKYHFPILTASLAVVCNVAMAEPNVLLIIADDMGLDASQCYDIGNQQAPMPNLEAMCASGLVFDNAYAQPTCSPTRATIMSGQYGFRTGVGAPVAPDGSDDLDPDTFTLFDALAPTGYAANVIGKWHITGRQMGFDLPEQMGVPDYFGLFYGGVQDYFNWTAVEGGQEVQIEGYATTVLTDRAIGWIEEQDAPWFLWLAYNAPHSPFHLPPNELHSFDDLPDDEASVDANPLPYYQAMLEALDTEIGRLLNSLSAEDRAKTVVMFIGDNGTPNQVLNGLYGDHQAKATLYDSGTHVPMIVSGPGIEAGRTDAFINASDLTATIAGLAGAEFSSPDSFDFGSVLLGGDGSRDYIYTDHFTNRETRGGGIYGWALREGNYRLVVPRDAPAELFDLSLDPLEQVNLLADGGTDEVLQIEVNLRARRDALVATAN